MSCTITAKRPHIVALTALSRPTQTLLDNARALCDWMTDATELEHMQHNERIVVMTALRSMLSARRAELALRGQECD
jgi:hypothetical protein